MNLQFVPGFARVRTAFQYRRAEIPQIRLILSPRKSGAEATSGTLVPRPARDYYSSIALDCSIVMFRELASGHDSLGFWNEISNSCRSDSDFCSKRSNQSRKRRLSD